jgi:hypothetical protein
VPTFGAAVVGKDSSGNPVAPRQRRPCRHIIDATPDHQHHLGKDVVDHVAAGATEEISLQGFENLSCH